MLTLRPAAGTGSRSPWPAGGRLRRRAAGLGAEPKEGAHPPEGAPLVSPSVVCRNPSERPLHQQPLRRSPHGSGRSAPSRNKPCDRALSRPHLRASVPRSGSSRTYQPSPQPYVHASVLQVLSSRSGTQLAGSAYPRPLRLPEVQMPELCPGYHQAAPPQQLPWPDRPEEVVTRRQAALVRRRPCLAAAGRDWPRHVSGAL